MIEDKKCPICRGSMHKTELSSSSFENLPKDLKDLPVYECDYCLSLICFIPSEIRSISGAHIIL
jgi:hypothetical protein